MELPLSKLMSQQQNEYFNLEKQQAEAQIKLTKQQKVELSSFKGKAPDSLKQRHLKEMQQLNAHYDAKRKEMVKLHNEQRDFVQKTEKVMKLAKEAQQEEERLAKEAREKKVQEFLNAQKNKGKDKDYER